MHLSSAITLIGLTFILSRNKKQLGGLFPTRLQGFPDNNKCDADWPEASPGAMPRRIQP